MKLQSKTGSGQRFGSDMKSVVMFMTSNGAGLGHLTRSMAVARRLPPDLKPVFFTLSQGAPIVRDQGFFVEYMPSADSFRPGNITWISRMRWNILLRHRIRELIEWYKPEVVVFDGTHPYNGLLAVMQEHRKPHWIWCRRGMWMPGLGKRSIPRAALFDSTIEPGEFAEKLDRGITAEATDLSAKFSPVLYLDRDELLNAEEAKAGLGLKKKNRLRALIQLGAGNINDYGTPLAGCVEHLSKHENTEIVIANSRITLNPYISAGNVKVIETYPLSRYFNAFDFAVSAAGYNTYHELLASHLPSIFIPNTETSLDDQLSRALYAQERGVALCCDNRNDSLSDCLDRMMDGNFRDGIRKKLESLSISNGASKIADFIVSKVKK